MAKVKLIKALNAVTANASSGLIWIGDYTRVGIRLSRDVNEAGGSSNFTVMGGFGQLASDSPTMVAYNMLIDNVTNTNGQTLTRVATKVITNATTNVLVWLTPEAMPTHIQVALVEGTDGTHSADVLGYTD